MVRFDPLKPPPKDDQRAENRRRVEHQSRMQQAAKSGELARQFQSVLTANAYAQKEVKKDTASRVLPSKLFDTKKDNESDKSRDKALMRAVADKALAEDHGKKTRALVHRVIEEFKKEKDGRSTATRTHEDKGSSLKKSEEKKEKEKARASSHKAHENSVDADTHQRVDSIESDHEHEGGMGQGSAGDGDDSQTGMSFDSSAGGFEFSSRDDSPELAHAHGAGLGKFVHERSAGSSLDSGGSPAHDQQIFQKNLEALVESVILTVNNQGHHEIMLSLAEPAFHGLGLKLTQDIHGIRVVFICPNERIRRLFAKNRLQILDRLKAKGLKVTQVDIA